MKRITGHAATVIAVGVMAGLCSVESTAASDISCKPAAGEAAVRCNNPDGSGVRCALATDAAPSRGRHALICDSSRLSERYERIYAEQQRMLHKGRIDNADISAWRARRDACDSARCLESLFAKFWRERDSMKAPGGRPTPESQAARVPITRPVQPPAAAPVPATTVTAVPDTPPETAMPAPQPVQEPTVDAQSAATAVTPADPALEALPFIETLNSTPGKTYPAALTIESLFSGLAVIGMGAGLLLTRRTPGMGQGWRRRIPAAIAIAFCLLLVNALLLPFTLAL